VIEPLDGSMSVSLSDISVTLRLFEGWQTPCDAAPARRERTRSAIGARWKRRRVEAGKGGAGPGRADLVVVSDNIRFRFRLLVLIFKIEEHRCCCSAGCCRGGRRRRR